MLTLLLSVALASAGSQVSIGIESGAGVPERLPIVLRRIDPTGQPDVRATIERDEIQALTLDAGQWQLDVVSSEVWHPPQFLSVEPHRNATLMVRVWPAASLSAEIAHDAKHDPAAVIVRFEPADEAESRHGPSGQVTCPIEARRIKCVLPAGVHRLRMRPKGFIAHSFPRLELTRGRTAHLGSLSFRQGQSITGRIELPRRYLRDIRTVQVTATPVGGTAGRLATIHARPDQAGRFQLEGVEPGNYRVTASLRELLKSRSVDVGVRAGSEAELIRPLRLAQPKRIELAVLPAMSPEGKRWHIKLRSAEDGRAEDVAASYAGVNGVWSSPPLQPGTYTATIGTITGDQWDRRTFDVAEDDVNASVILAGSVITGSVKLGLRPLAGTVTFSDRTRFSVEAASDQHGRFHVVLPSTGDGRLRATIRSGAPWVHRTLPVSIAGEDSTVDLVIPDNVIAGTVVDQRGMPVENALVWITRGDPTDEPLLQPSTDPEGAFQVHGLDLGEYTLSATSFLSTSTQTRVVVSEEEPSLEVRLVLEDDLQLHGTVSSPAAPVAGARIEVAATNVPQLIVHNRRTDDAGRFAAALPAGARTYEMTVRAPGFSFVLTGGTLAGGPIQVRVEQNGGTVRIHSDDGSTPYLVHRGGTCPVTAVMRDWPSRHKRVSGNGQETELLMMEPGAYSACIVGPSQVAAFRAAAGQTGGRCATGYLPPFGVLTLDLRSP